MKKCIFIATLFLLMFGFSSLQAQYRVAPKLAVGYNYIGEIRVSDRIPLEMEGGLSIAMGGEVERYVEFWLSIQAGLEYSFNYFSLASDITHGNGALGTPNNETVQADLQTLNYQWISLPLLAKFSPFEEHPRRLSPIGAAGFKFSLETFREDNDYTVHDFFDTRTFIPEFTLGLGTRYRFDTEASLQLMLTYNRTISPYIMYEFGDDRRINHFMLSLSVFL